MVTANQAFIYLSFLRFGEKRRSISAAVIDAYQFKQTKTGG
jgi:hypothetical protein